MPLLTARDIAAVVVLYQPDEPALGNILATAAQVDHVYVIDNTEEPDGALVSALAGIPGLTYSPLGDNMGIAAALNVGVALARDVGYAWVLTMDQDTTPEHDMVAALASCISACDVGSPIGTVGAQRPRLTGRMVKFEGCRELLMVITAGSILNVAAWEQVGRFDKSLFIDQVDHDLCLRMKRAGFAVLSCGEAGMRHSIGAASKHRFLWWKAYTLNHSPVRRYYITRNRFAMLARYGEEFPSFRERQMRYARKEFVKMVMFEDHRFAKLLMAWRGYRDFKRDVTGRFPG